MQAKYFSLLCIVLLFLSCSDTCSTNLFTPEGSESKGIVLDYGSDENDDDGWLCEEGSDGLHNMTVIVTVTVLSDNTTFDSQIYEITNEEFKEEEDVLTFNVPSNGGYVVDVYLSGSECMSCCNLICNGLEGRPIFVEATRTFPQGTLDFYMFFDMELGECLCC